MTGITIAAGLGFVALIAFIFIKMRAQRSADSDKDRPAKIEPQVATTAPIKTPEIPDELLHHRLTLSAEQKELSEDLSQSGALTIDAEVIRCIDAEKWDEAIKWLLHASAALPERTDFKVTLAEVYAKTEDRENFTALFEKLYVDIDDSSEHMVRLLHVAREFIPHHAVFQPAANLPTED